MSLWHKPTFLTRKSSCVNASGIPTAAYQVLHLLSCTGGYPLPYPPLRGGTPSLWGLPHLGYPHQTWPGGTPSLPGGYPTSCTPHQTWPGGTPSLLGCTPPRVPPITPGWGGDITPARGASEAGIPLAGVPPPPAGPGWATPLVGPGLDTPGWTWLGYSTGWTWPPEVWTDRHLWKQYLTVVLRTRSLKITTRPFYKHFLPNWWRW